LFESVSNNGRKDFVVSAAIDAIDAIGVAEIKPG